ncbi:DNA cytosine methyltransferase [Klebsiella pneumoniae]|uniref:DNA cytosine methyltransferase n=2 Tax=Klebsiella pneumoniae TaxID=573 RepID=UPI000BD00EBC|nr:DNA cytosine methyltransferase [Klebsiella pneumoniae]MBC8812106.1 DNA cytosine methyltransferase [Klebsiella pneumoniae]MBC8908921.1 DNA cytosine methyltransferase [Klebsiella pneumoniae]MDI2750900.1 DNA cytosine methyltransferase [Klebsiella pneumoniae]PCO36638.1 DNA cytosine methyltransferase [Klebsiella pneumoniae]HCT3744284.1 DNA cytosine methyltransferase [Klebsiella pneumoniae]
MVAYYNEIDLHAAQHLRNLIDAGHIAPGVVDTRSIEDVTPNDLIGFNQCHFFAGIGGWSLALRRAGWPDSRPAWTASCPCQPFSQAGKGLGFADERHLWPSAHWLVGQRRPVVVFGEQSGSADANDWIDLVQNDVEALGYAFGATAFPSASVGAPHQRDRAYWVADADCQQWEGRGELQPTGGGKPSDSRVISGLAHTDGNGREGRLSGRTDPQREAINGQAGRGCAISGLADANHEQRSFTMPARSYADVSRQWNKDSEAAAGCSGVMRPGPVNGFWRDADWLYGRDGWWRPVRPKSFPLADGIPARVGRLRTYGNAINIEAATAFIKSYMAAVDYA